MNAWLNRLIRALSIVAHFFLAKHFSWLEVNLGSFYFSPSPEAFFINTLSHSSILSSFCFSYLDVIHSARVGLLIVSTMNFVGKCSKDRATFILGLFKVMFLEHAAFLVKIVLGN